MAINPNYGPGSDKYKRYICQKCGAGGAHWKEFPVPFCHECHKLGVITAMRLAKPGE